MIFFPVGIEPENGRSKKGMQLKSWSFRVKVLDEQVFAIFQPFLPTTIFG